MRNKNFSNGILFAGSNLQLHFVYSDIVMMFLVGTVEMQVINMCGDAASFKNCVENLIETHISSMFIKNSHKCYPNCTVKYEGCIEGRDEMIYPCKNAFSQCDEECKIIRFAAYGTEDKCKATCEADFKMCNDMAQTFAEKYMCVYAELSCTKATHCNRPRS